MDDADASRLRTANDNLHAALSLTLVRNKEISFIVMKIEFNSPTVDFYNAIVILIKMRGELHYIYLPINDVTVI